ncbi:MAG: D-alanine--D-alanine ligase [Chloroflexi bacterium]|nr:D-alanine--D-alanine ligase [Chloroflexota bacterium]
MKIGLAYDLKEEVAISADQPEDALEEYDSVETVAGLTTALEAAGHHVIKLGGGRPFLSRILERGVDFVFNIAEGRGGYKGRESQVPSVLEMLDVPYSGSDPVCLAVCLDKPLTKTLVGAAGIRTPTWRVVASRKDLEAPTWDNFPFPAFVKPAHEGSSKGVRRSSRVTSAEQMVVLVSRLLADYRQPVMVEEFVDGDEVTVGIVGNQPPVIVSIMRVLPREKGDYFVYSLEVKRDWENLVEYECPARLASQTLRAIEGASLKAFDLLGCRDFARLDFRVDHVGTPYFLEINPLAGLNPRSSDLPIMARKMGWTYERLVAAILQAALERYPACA